MAAETWAHIVADIIGYSVVDDLVRVSSSGVETWGYGGDAVRDASQGLE